jgi:uncharacterized protein YndB with AHSA1/START domain
MSHDGQDHPGKTAAPYRDPNDLRLGGFIDRETFRFVRDYPHAPAEVWAALTDAEQLNIWLWPCQSFEARLGGIGVFNPGKELILQVTEFEPQRRLTLGQYIRFELTPLADGCRLTLDLTRAPDGWSPMALAGFHGWLGRLSRLLARRPQEETEAWALGIWNAVIGHCEWELSRWTAGGAKAIWRLHFAENDAALSAEAEAQTDALARLLVDEGRAVTLDGFGDDPVSSAASVTLCAQRIEAIVARLQARGVPKARINVGFVLGNYHPMVERDSAVGRAFNRRIELRPVY